MPFALGSRAESRYALLTGAVLLAIASSVAVQAQATRKSAPTKRVDDSNRQMQLRFRLKDNPHDQQAHDELVKMFRAKYAFRAEMEEDGEWLRNNPTDFETEVQMRSLATAAVHDPEYAISTDRYVLAHAERSDDPNDYDFVKDRLAFALLDRHRTAEGVEILTRATTETPSDAGVWENLGDAQVRASQFAAAIPSYKKAIELDGNQENPHQGLANAFFKSGQYSEAEVELNAAIAVYNGQYHGDAPSDTFHIAMKRLQAVTHNEPTLASLDCQLARVFVEEHKFDKALAEVDKATLANPEEKINYEYLEAAIYESAGQPQQAEATRRKAQQEVQAVLKKEPTNNEMAAAVAYPETLFMSIEGDDLTSAREVIHFLEPLSQSGTLKSMDLVDLGFAYCTVDRPIDCKHFVEAGFRLGSKLDNPVSEHHLAEALLESGDPDGAREHFQQAYEREPQNLTFRMDYEASKRSIR